MWGCWRSQLRLLRARRRAGVAAPDSKIQKGLGKSSAFSTKKDEPVASDNPTDTKTSLNQEKAKQVLAKKNLLNIIGEMKVEISTKKKLQMLKAQKEKEKDQLSDFPENMESTSSMFQKAAGEKAKSGKTLNPELMAAASAVASSLPFDRKRTVSELLQLLRKHKEVTDARKNGDTTNISNIITNMTIGKKLPTRNAFRASNQIQFDDDGRGYTLERELPRDSTGMKRRGLYSGKRLNIFDVTPTSATEATLETVAAPTLWDLELANAIAAVSQHPPRNGFEEMLQWTKEGKLWTFPVNNEAGLEDDAEFHDHIFLEKHLADFPKEGPIRHFMELVICGLSKNPYLSVREKEEHIEWFQQYFKAKEELLQEIEAHERGICGEREAEAHDKGAAMVRETLSK